MTFDFKSFRPGLIPQAENRPPLACATPLTAALDYMSDETLRSILTRDRSETIIKAWKGRTKNQRSHGSCAGQGSSRTMERARAMAGFDYVMLSGTCIYANSKDEGADNGALTSTVMQVLKDKGTTTESQMPWDKINRRDFTPEIQRDIAGRRYAADSILRIEPNADFKRALLTAAATNHSVCAAVHVGNGYTANNGKGTNASGIAGIDRGPGNHCQCITPAAYWDDAVKDFVFVLDQSWGESYGFDGYNRCVSGHFTETAKYHDFTVLLVENWHADDMAELPEVA